MIMKQSLSIGSNEVIVNDPNASVVVEKQHMVVSPTAASGAGTGGGDIALGHSSAVSLPMDTAQSTQVNTARHILTMPDQQGNTGTQAATPFIKTEEVYQVVSVASDDIAGAQVTTVGGLWVVAWGSGL